MGNAGYAAKHKLLLLDMSAYNPLWGWTLRVISHSASPDTQ